MMQFPGNRRVLAAAIAAALVGTASAADPQLVIVGKTDPIPLAEVGFTPGTRLLQARSLAGNFDCGSATAPANGTMQLELDGRRYEIVAPANGTAIAYKPGQVSFEFALNGVVSTANCLSTGATVMDLVAIGADGQPTAKSRIGQAVQMSLPTTGNPTVLADLTLMDPIRCESYGLNPDRIDVALTDANGAATDLTGVEGFEYRLAEVGGRRELRMLSSTAPSGVQRVQCTSPGYAFGRDAAGSVPGRVFFSAFEAAEALADVNLTVGGGWALTDGNGDTRIRIPSSGIGSDGARVELTVFNPSRSAAADIRIREYVPVTADATAMRVIAGTEAVACQPLPADASPNPCASAPTSAGFPLSFAVPTLAAGTGMRLTVHRQLAAGVVGGSVDVGYAAFVDPQPAAGAAADAVLGNNAKWVDFAVS